MCTWTSLHKSACPSTWAPCTGARFDFRARSPTVLSVLSSPAYVEWAREQIREGLEAVGRDGGHRVATFALYSVDHDSSRAKEAIREAVAYFFGAELESALVRVPGVPEEASVLLARGGTAHLAREMPAQWINELAVAGDPDECARGLRNLLQAGADSVDLWLFPPNGQRRSPV